MALAALMLLQAGPPGPAATPRHMRYERTIVLPPKFAGGVACAVLDATALAHAASRSGDDLRVFAERDGAAPVETLFALTESEAAPGDAEPAAVENLALQDGAIEFDLAMPHRAYTEVDLQLAAKDFVGTAQVWGMPAASAEKVALGSFAVFDLTGEGLARSTTLPLQESTFPVLHIELHLRGAKGSKLPGLSAVMVRGADVPPSREAQTLYTTVARTGSFGQQGSWTTAKIHVPAHVPVERVSFALDPRDARSFWRAVTVVAKPDAPYARMGIVVAEAVDGEIWRVVRPSGWAGAPAIDAAKLSVDAVLASNLRAPATVTVVVKNGTAPPLPLRAVELEMRERKVCFAAQPGKSYMLAYGDAALEPPVAGIAALLQPGAKPVAARLGPERRNPHYVAEADVRPYAERHPELPWIALLAGIAVLGTVAMQIAMRRGDHG